MAPCRGDLWSTNIAEANFQRAVLNVFQVEVRSRRHRVGLWAGGDVPK